MKKYFLLVSVSIFLFSTSGYCQDINRGNEFLSGKDCVFYDSLFYLNVNTIYTSALPKAPTGKDEFETTEEFNKRKLNFDNEIKAFNSSTLKVTKVTNVPIYNIVKYNKNFEYGAFKYDADTKIMTIVCYLPWCLKCTDYNVYGIAAPNVSYNANPNLKIFSLIETDWMRSPTREFFYYVRFEVEPNVAKEVKNFTQTGEGGYSITFQISPRLVKNDIQWRLGKLIPYFFVDNYWLVKDGQIVTKFNPKNLPTFKRTDVDFLTEMVGSIINQSDGYIYNY